MGVAVGVCVAVPVGKGDGSGVGVEGFVAVGVAVEEGCDLGSDVAA